MHSVPALMVPAALLLLLVWCAGQAAAQAAPAPTPGPASACPITEFSKVDWTTVKSTCREDAPDFCDTCICGIGTALVTGLEAAGVKINGQPISALAAAADGAAGAANSSTVNNILNQCAATLGLQLLQSNAVTSGALTQLSKCDVQTAGRTCYDIAVKADPSAQAAAEAAAASSKNVPVAAASGPPPPPARSGAGAGAQPVHAAALLAALVLVAALVLA